MARNLFPAALVTGLPIVILLSLEVEPPTENKGTGEMGGYGGGGGSLT